MHTISEQLLIKKNKKMNKKNQLTAKLYTNKDIIINYIKKQEITKLPLDIQYAENIFFAQKFLKTQILPEFKIMQKINDAENLSETFVLMTEYTTNKIELTNTEYLFFKLQAFNQQLHLMDLGPIFTRKDYDKSIEKLEDIYVKSVKNVENKTDILKIKKKKSDVKCYTIFDNYIYNIMKTLLNLIKNNKKIQKKQELTILKQFENLETKIITTFFTEIKKIITENKLNIPKEIKTLLKDNKELIKLT